MPKYTEQHWKLLAGLIDEDELEETRHIVAKQVEDTFDSDIRETSFKTNILLEQVSYHPDPYEEDAVHSDHSEHAALPHGYKFEDPDAEDADIYDDKVEDEHEYTHAIKIGQTKVRESNMDDFCDKYSLEEGWRDSIIKKKDESLITVPAGLLSMLAAWHGGQGTATYAVLSTGAVGIPKSYIEATISEIESTGEKLHSNGHLSPEDAEEANEIINGLTSLIDGGISSHSSVHSLPESEEESGGEGESDSGYEPVSTTDVGGSMLEDEDLLLDDAGPKDLVAAIISGHGLVGVSDEPGATSTEYWGSTLVDAGRWELVWLKDVPEHVAEQLKHWEHHFKSGKEAVAAAIPYIDEVIADQDETSSVMGKDSVSSRGNIDQYF